MMDHFTVYRVEAEVERLRGEFDTSDPFELALRMNILVEHHEYPSLLGFCCKILGHTVIALNSKADEITRRCICAHNLGHIALKHDSDTNFSDMHYCSLSDLTDKFETEANMFAAALLINKDKAIKAIAESTTVNQAAMNLYVTPSILQVRSSMLRTKPALTRFYNLPNS